MAEGAFEDWASNARTGYVRFGLDRPPIHVHRLPAFIRYTPDYLTTKSLVEVQGFGRDQTLKLKIEKLAALGKWADIHPVKMFCWDSTNQRAFMVDHEALVQAAEPTTRQATLGSFPEGHQYWGYGAELLGEIGELL